MKNTAVATLMVAVSTAFTASAAPYIGAGINYSQLKDADDGGISYEGVFGLGIGDALRAEAQLGYDPAEVGNVDIDVWNLFANLYYDFQLDGAFTPYILGGIGYSSVKIEDLSSEGSFAGQLGAGIGFNLGESWVIDLKYRYIMSQEYYDSFNFNTHQLGAGVRFHF